MKRQFILRPGYDCRKECSHEPKGEHGICSDVWFYVVSEGPHAVSLEIFSADYPPTVERATLTGFLQRPFSGGLFFHHADPSGNRCEFVEGGLCKSDCSYRCAQDLWEAHGNPNQREQGEAFWLALEARLPE